MACCQVCGVGPLATPYEVKKRACKQHLAADDVALPSQPGLHRFCHQCGRFEPLHCFDGMRRSCRERLHRRRSSKLAPSRCWSMGPSSRSGSVASGSALSAAALPPPADAASCSPGQPVEACEDVLQAMFTRELEQLQAACVVEEQQAALARHSSLASSTTCCSAADLRAACCAPPAGAAPAAAGAGGCCPAEADDDAGEGACLHDIAAAFAGRLGAMVEPAAPAGSAGAPDTRKQRLLDEIAENFILGSKRPASAACSDDNSDDNSEASGMPRAAAKRMRGPQPAAPAVHALALPPVPALLPLPRAPSPASSSDSQRSHAQRLSALQYQLALVMAQVHDLRRQLGAGSSGSARVVA